MYAATARYLARQHDQGGKAPPRDQPSDQRNEASSDRITRIEVHPDAADLATAVAGELLSRLADAQDAGRLPHIGLTGGTIAEAVHREIARLSPGSEVDWS